MSEQQKILDGRYISLISRSYKSNSLLAIVIALHFFVLLKKMTVAKEVGMSMNHATWIKLTPLSFSFCFIFFYFFFHAFGWSGQAFGILLTIWFRHTYSSMLPFMRNIMLHASVHVSYRTMCEF